MLDVKALTTEELRQTAERIREELALRQAELQRTCPHHVHAAWSHISGLQSLS